MQKRKKGFSDITIYFHIYLSVLSIAFIDVVNLFADPACTCHCRMHFVSM